MGGFSVLFYVLVLWLAWLIPGSDDLSSPQQWLQNILLAALLFVFGMAFIGWAIILAAPVATVTIISGLNALIILPFAWLMERGDKGVKVVSFALLLVGFHFDLLAS